MNTTQQNIQWCQNLWQSIKLGGVWGIPRSGLMFRKTEKGFDLVDIARPVNKGFSAFQRQDYECQVQHFALANLKITDSQHLLKS